jgi:hypothetical protein
MVTARQILIVFALLVVACKSGDNDGAKKTTDSTTTGPSDPTVTAAPKAVATSGAPGGEAPKTASTDASVVAVTADPGRVLIAAGRLFWIENRDYHRSKLKSVPVGGGEVKVVVDMPDLTGHYTTDGSSIYFLTSGNVLHKTSLDGTGTVTLATLAFSSGAAADLVVKDGNVYWAGAEVANHVIVTGIWSVPATPTEPPTAPKVVLPAGSNGQGMPGPSVLGLFFVEPSGFYFGMLTNFGAGMICSAPNRTGLQVLFTDDNSGTMTPMTNTIRVVGNDVYFITGNGATKPRSSTLWKAPAAGGEAKRVAELPGMEIGSMNGDANGWYVTNTSHKGEKQGVYSIDLATGKTTLFATTPELDVMAQPRMVVTDDQYVYFLDGGHNPGSAAQPANATIYRKARK